MKIACYYFIAVFAVIIRGVTQRSFQGRSIGRSSKNEVSKPKHQKELLLYGIVGGTEAKVSEFPFMVSIQVHRGNNVWQHMCGGSLISPNWVLTAGHCKPQLEPFRTRVVAGCQKWRVSGEFDCQISEFKVCRDMINHEHIHIQTYTNDIALIRLKTPLRSSRSAPISNVRLLPRGTAIPRTAVVAGWGQLSWKGRIAESLMMVDVKILKSRDCSNYNNFREGIMICAGHVEGVRDACSGDSGGPLMVKTNGITYQIGIVSSGNECAKAGYPGLYTNVMHFRPWIEAKTGLRFP